MRNEKNVPKDTTNKPNSIINGETLKRIRKAFGFKQKEMADILGIPNTRYSNYENGYSVPPDEIINKFCSFFSISKENYSFTLEEEQKNLYKELRILDSDFNELRRTISVIDNKKLRRKLIFEFGNIIDDFLGNIKEVINE